MHTLRISALSFRRSVLPGLFLLAVLVAALPCMAEAGDLHFPTLSFNWTLPADGTLIEARGFYDVTSGTLTGKRSNSFGEPFTVSLTPSSSGQIALALSEEIAKKGELFSVFTPFSPNLHSATLALDVTFRRGENTYATRFWITLEDPSNPLNHQKGVGELQTLARRLLNGLEIKLDENQEMRKNRLWNATLQRYVPTGKWTKNGSELSFADDLPSLFR